MDTKHVQISSSTNILQRATKKIKSYEYVRYLSIFDPTRLKKITDREKTKLKSKIKDLYTLSSKISKNVVIDEDFVVAADIYSGLGGGIEYTEPGKEINTYILSWFKPEINTIEGSTFFSVSPIFSYYNRSCLEEKEKEKDEEKNHIPIFVPSNSGSFVLFNKFENSNDCNKSNDMIICPGRIKFSVFEYEGVDTLFGLYEPVSEESVYNFLDNDNSYYEELKIEDLPIENITTSDILDYLVHVHTRKVQSGYYSPINSDENLWFDYFMGKEFYVDTTEDVSYYEKIIELKEYKNMFHPMGEYPHKNIVNLFARGCDIKNGPVTKPILLNINKDHNSGFTEVISVDVRLLDLNFLWTIIKSVGLDSNKKQGTFSTSINDTNSIFYYTHSPGVFVVIGGKIKGSKINLS